MGQSRVLSLRRADVCVTCGHRLQVGDHAFWHATEKVVECLACHPERATPGASAERISRTQRERREQPVRDRHPHVGGLLLAMQTTPQHEKAWASGAVGERTVGNTLNALAERNSMFVLHDRRIPGSRANIDHIVVAPSGIWVIDAKRYQRKRVEVRVRQQRPTLFVGGRDQRKLVDSVMNQAAVVGRVLDIDISVRPVLCFVEASWGLFNTVTDIDRLLVCPPDRLAKVLLRHGPITEDGVVDIGRSLSRSLRAA